MYRPRSCSSISSLRTGRPFAAGCWARARIWSGVGHRLTGRDSPFVRVDDEAGQGLRVEVGRLLGHDVAPDRATAAIASTGVGSSRNAASAPSVAASTRLERLGGGLRVADPIAARDGRRVEARERAPGPRRGASVERRDRRRHAVAAGPSRTPRGGRSGSSRRRASRARTGRRRRAAESAARTRAAARERDGRFAPRRGPPARPERRRRRRRRDRGRRGGSAGPSAARRSTRGGASAGSRTPGPPRTIGVIRRSSR